MNTRLVLRFLGHQKYLRFGIRDRIIRQFHNPDTSESEEFIVPFFGARYRGNFDTFIDWSVYYYGAYSLEELRLIEDFLEPVSDPIFLDVGANVGHHTLFAALKCRLVLSFEPFRNVARKIEQKIDDNNLTNVTLCRFGLARLYPFGRQNASGRVR
jgi:tRNA G46 methylase TrmB